jgi:hypothetical protein
MSISIRQKAHRLTVKRGLAYNLYLNIALNAFQMVMSRINTNE